MKNLLIIIFLSHSFAGFSQQRNDIIFLKDIKLIQTTSGKAIPRSEFNIKTLIEYFGQPDKIIKQEASWALELCYYNSNSFEIPLDPKYPDSFRLLTNDFKLTIQDSIALQVGETITKLETSFPRSAQNISVHENGVKSITLTYGLINDQKVTLTDSWIMIDFDSISNKIIRIYDTTLN